MIEDSAVLKPEEITTDAVKAAEKEERISAGFFNRALEAESWTSRKCKIAHIALANTRKCCNINSVAGYDAVLKWS